MHNAQKKIGIIGLIVFVGGTFSACTTVEDPEDPGFNKPAVTGVLKGDITTWEEYRAALKKENRRANRDGPRWNDGVSDDF